MVAVFMVLWMAASIATGFVATSVVRLIVASTRRYEPASMWNFVLALFMVLASITLLALLGVFTQEMLANR